MRYTVEVTPEKTVWYREGTNALHREDGPAIVFADGTKRWYVNGWWHREDGPAVEYADGSKYWYVNGHRHREDGPAVEYADGSKSWYVNDRLHREDGPAVEHTNGTKQWFINGTQLTEQEFLERTAPVKELTVAEIEQLLGCRVKVVK